MMENINTRNYWEQRFSSGDWELKQGRWQTENFAKGQIPYLRIRSDFAGTLLDFGCGLGDALPVYKENFPNATLVGMDISQSAIDLCQERYGTIGTFLQGDHTNVPPVDVIIASNVLEHLTNDHEIARQLFSKCKSLYIIVPYKECPLCLEHVNSYDESSFTDIGNSSYNIFSCIGWTPMGFRNLWYQVYFKNISRLLFKKPIRRRNMQIMFIFTNQICVSPGIDKDSVLKLS
jgi:SAM-dependent methyltransferase